MLNRLLIYTIIVFLFQSCSIEKNREIRNHSILNIIIQDKKGLENKNILLNDTDTIVTRKLNLIGESAKQINLNLGNNSISFFGSYTSFNFDEHPFFKNSMDTILNNISKAKKTIWKSELINDEINIIKVDVEKDSLEQDRIINWITSNISNSDFIYVSEPIENNKKDLLVCTKTFTTDYCFETIYILKKTGDSWEISQKSTTVTKLVVEKIGDNVEKMIEIYKGQIE
nr:hypothetical protein [uncultured Draconibacterium sp.]